MCTLLSLGIGLIFVGSGAAKLRHIDAFAGKIAAYSEVLAADYTTLFRKLVPARWAIALGVSCAEVLLGAALVCRCYVGVALTALLLLTSFFACLTLYTAMYKRMATCGCFGRFVALTPWQSFCKSVLIGLSLLYLAVNE